MALTNMEGRRPNLVSKRERTVERERREGEKKKKRRRREAMITKVWNFGFCMETHLGYEFYEIWHGSLGLYDD